MMSRVRTAVLLALLTALMLWVGNLLGGYTGLIIAFVFVIVFNGVMYFFSDKIVLKMYHATEVTEKEQPELYKMVREVVHLAQIPMPKVYIIPSDALNAFATGRNPKNAAVAFTKGILSTLSKDELRGVTAHEISHVKNRDILITTIAGVIAGVIGYVASMARWAAIFGGFGGRDNDSNILELLALAILAPLIAVLLQLAISRSREYLADETGAKIIKNPYALANALEKLEKGAKHKPFKFGSKATSSMFIVNPFRGNALLNLFSTHPPMEQRIKKLRNMRV